MSKNDTTKKSLGKIKRPSKAKAHDKETDAAFSDRILTTIVSCPDYDRAYDETLSELKGRVDCTVLVEGTEVPSGYKALSIEPCKRCISFKRADGAIGYQVLTHRFFGTSVEFGAAFTSAGTLELYSLSLEPESGIDGKLIAVKTLSSHIVDPIAVLASEEGVYVVYNDPSAEALASTPQGRRPDVVGDDGRIAIASGHPNVALFNMVTGEQDKLISNCEDMGAYGIAIAQMEGTPILVVANVFDEEDAEKDDRPSFSSLFSPSKSRSAGVSYPKGVSFVQFVSDSEITQVPFDGDSAGESQAVILKAAEGEETRSFAVLAASK